MSDSVPEEKQVELKQEAVETIEKTVIPAFNKLRIFIENVSVFFVLSEWILYTKGCKLWDFAFKLLGHRLVIYIFYLVVNY